MENNFAGVLTQVTGIFKEVLETDNIKLEYHTSAKDIEEWDSLNHIELVVAIEKHFKIKFNFSELQKFKNVGEMCDNIVLRVNK